MNKSNILVSVIVSIVISLGVGLMVRAPAPAQQPLGGLETVKLTMAKGFTANANSDITSGTFTINTSSVTSGGVTVKSSTRVLGGVTFTDTSSTLKTATTTVCAIQSPAATTTLLAASIGFTLSTSTAHTTTVAKAATAFATTTVLDREADIANGVAPAIMIPWNTVNTIATSTLLFAPSQWVVVGMEGNVGTYSPTGLCTASFRGLN